MTITTHMILGQNESTIERCLASVLPLNGKIIAIDFDADQKTIAACRAAGAETINLPFNNNFSELRNSVVAEDGLHLQIEPWEVLVSGHNEIQKVDRGQSYFLQIVQGSLIWKETRLWHSNTGLRYSNPVCESLPLEGSKCLPQVILYCQEGNRRNQEMTRALIEKWKADNPTKNEPMYCSACEYLVCKEYDLFIKEANRYLFHANASRMKTMIRYYLSAVQLYCKKDSKSTIQNILQCIAENPMMAEFWCLLGDVHCKKHLYDKAKAFFRNAVIMGRQRSQSDFWPLDVPKYKKYPERMISGCDKMLKESKIYGAST